MRLLSSNIRKVFSLTAIYQISSSFNRIDSLPACYQKTVAVLEKQAFPASLALQKTEVLLETLFHRFQLDKGRLPQSLVSQLLEIGGKFQEEYQ